MMMSTAPNLSSRGLRPIAELAATRDHGDRLRYMAGCRCADCRRANCAYEKARVVARKAGDWNGIVAASRARGHLAALSRQGVGRRAVGDTCGVADTVLSAIITGRKTNIRARTERLILAVTPAAAADRALIPAAPTWMLLDELIADGYTKSELAKELGYQTHALQLSRQQVTVRNAYDVQRLYEKWRTCDPKPTQRLLDDLADEGYTRSAILDGIAHLAFVAGLPSPRIHVPGGGITVVAARLIKQLHVKLTE